MDNLITAGFGVDVSTAGGSALQVAMHNYLAVDSARDDTSHELVRFFRTMFNLHKQGVKVEAALKRVLAAGPEFRIGLGSDGTRFKPTTAQIAASQAQPAPQAQGETAASNSSDGDDAMTVTDLCGEDGTQGAADSTEGSIHVNFLDRMISAGMSLREVAGETNHLNGAHKAFAVELTFSLYELARKQSVVDRMRAEMAAALAANGNGRAFPVRDDMPALQYSQAVFREVLRMHCISMGILRVTAEPVSVPAAAAAGAAPATPEIVLPPNTPVLMLMHAVHHLPEFWEAPLEFRPERWLKPNGKLRSGPRTKFSYFPFLEGPRQCQGRFLVVLEWLVVVNAIIQQYDIALPLAYKLRKKADFYPIPEDPIRIRFEPRVREAPRAVAIA